MASILSAILLTVESVLTTQIMMKSRSLSSSTYASREGAGQYYFFSGLVSLRTLSKLPNSVRKQLKKTSPP